MAKENELDEDSKPENNTGISVVQVPEKMDPEFVISLVEVRNT